jgi:sugar lactone lactonase YvrE
MTPRLFDDRPCRLGEGPLWHPLRNQLFWCDIEGRSLLTCDGDGPKAWTFDDPVSAAGWIDSDTLLVASARALLRFDVTSGRHEAIAPLEADDPRTRSNDGRADPWGGFWIGTMGRALEPAAGAIWRYFRGELRRLHAGVTIPNAICFAPDGRTVYFTDTPSRVVLRQRLAEADGWPIGAPEPFLDLRAEQLNPDGAVVDRDGRLWIAEWGAARVAVHGPDGALIDKVALPAPNVTCPAFGGADYATLHVTTAREGMTTKALAACPLAGATFAVEVDARGQAEHRVAL